MTEYEIAKNNILTYLEDRKKFLGIYNEIKSNIDAFKKVTKPYSYIPKELVEDFFNHIDKLMEENCELFDTDKNGRQ